MCGMAVTICSTCDFEPSDVWYGCYNLVNFWFSAQVFVVWLFQLGQLVVLSVKMCGMAVTIWSTCGFERKYVWYGCYNLVNLWFCAQGMCGMAVIIWSTCDIERKYVWYGCNNLFNL